LRCSNEPAARVPAGGHPGRMGNADPMRLRPVRRARARPAHLDGAPARLGPRVEP